MAIEFSQIDHRPYPMPSSCWTWKQSWCDLLFAHWVVPVAELQPLIPAELELDTYEGQAWVGVVPFTMHIRHRLAPPLPTASYFPELNVRTYVRHQGKPGVWFLSLDASSRLAVWAAKQFFHLPYSLASIESTVGSGDHVDYLSERAAGEASFSASYQPTGPVYHAQPGGLDHWLTERYCLYAQSKSQRIYRGEIHHIPWPLQPAKATLRCNTMLPLHGLTQPESKPLLHYVKQIDVALWPLAHVR